MGIYISLLLLSLIFLFFNKNSNKVIFSLFLVLLVLIPALRDLHIGADTYAYFSYFKNPHLGWGTIKTRTEIGYETLSSLTRGIYDNGYFFMFFCIIVSFIGPILLILKFSKNKYLSIFLLLTFGSAMSIYFMFFSMQRQIIAMSMNLIALYFFLKNKSRIDWKVIAFEVLAISFHITAVLTIIPFVISFIKYFNKYIYIAIVLLTFLLGAYMQKYISVISPYLDVIDKSQYILSMADKTFSYGVTFPLTFIVIVIIYFDKSSIFNTIMGKTLILGVVMNNLFYSVPESPRLVLYYLIVSILVFPQFIYFPLNNKLARKIILYFLLLFYTRMYVLNITSSNEGNPVVPYVSWIY